MGLRLWPALFGGASILLVTSLSRAQCTKDTDCKGDRICESGTCAAPPPQPAPPVTAPAPPPTAHGEVAPRRLDATASEMPVPRPPAARPAPTLKPRMQRHSTGMMVGGIVMTSLSPVALMVAVVADLQQTGCEGGTLGRSSLSEDEYPDCSRYDKTIYGGLLVGAGLLAVGIPMIVIGAKKEPVPLATIRGWVTPGGGGLGLRVDL